MSAYGGATTAIGVQLHFGECMSSSRGLWRRFHKGKGSIVIDTKREEGTGFNQLYVLTVRKWDMQDGFATVRTMIVKLACLH